jgi:hypothetical protein
MTSAALKHPTVLSSSSGTTFLRSSETASTDVARLIVANGSSDFSADANNAILSSISAAILSSKENFKQITAITHPGASLQESPMPTHLSNPLSNIISRAGSGPFITDRGDPSVSGDLPPFSQGSAKTLFDWPAGVGNGSAGTATNLPVALALAKPPLGSSVTGSLFPEVDAIYNQVNSKRPLKTTFYPSFIPPAFSCSVFFV